MSEDFGLDLDWMPKPLKGEAQHVPLNDPDYRFEPKTTRAILAGFQFNHRVLIQGLHGSGKSSHVEQVAARLNWPLMRVNLDSHVSRLDLIGKDAIVVEDGQQVTAFQEGILPWAMQRPMALLLDEYDAGRPDVLFVIQRLLEADGKLTLSDQNRVIEPHPQFRLFATCNTLGLGDETGLYAGTQVLNQAQLDRWTTVCRLDFMDEDSEAALIAAKTPGLGLDDALQMVRFANMTRASFRAGDLSILMSPRGLLHWGQGVMVFGGLGEAIEFAFLNRLNADERALANEMLHAVGLIEKDMENG